MEPAKDRMRNYVSKPLDRACAGRKTCVRTATIEPVHADNESENADFDL